MPAYRLSITLLILFSTLFMLPVQGQAQDQDQEKRVKQSNYSLGVEAYQEGDFRRSFDAWSLGAYEGSAEAQYNLGVLYLEGRGVERNIEQARAWFLKAAEKNQVEAQYNLGHMSLSGMGVKKNVQAALLWWKRAAEGGYAQAQFNYGRALYLGIEGYNDKKGGVSLIHLAAAQKDERAQAFLDDNADEIAQLNPTKNNLAANVEVARVEKPAVKAPPADVSLPDSEPGEVNLHIVRDKHPVQQDYLMRSAEEPVTIYTHADFQTPLGQLLPGTLLKVVRIEENKIQVLPAVGFSMWVERSSLNLHSIYPGVKKSGTKVYAQADGDEIGVLAVGVRIQVLEQKNNWVKVRRLTPAYGWIAASNLMYSGETSQQLRKAWQAELQVKNKPDPKPRAEAGIVSVEEQATPRLEQKITSKKIEKTEEPVARAPAQATTNSGQTPGNSSNMINDNVWLFTQNEGAYVVHLFTLLDFNKALAISRELAFRSQAHVYTTLVKQRQWTFVLLGPYANEKAATQARLALPAHYAKGARTRLISLIAENRCAKREHLEAHQAQGLDAYCF